MGEELDRYLMPVFQSLVQGKADEKLLRELSTSLFPLISENNIYFSLYKALSTFYIIRGNKGVTFEEATREFYAKCQDVGVGLLDLMKKVCDGEFFEKFRTKYPNVREKYTPQPVAVTIPPPVIIPPPPIPQK